jgi:hypothetical protein
MAMFKMEQFGSVRLLKRNKKIGETDGTRIWSNWWLGYH